MHAQGPQLLLVQGGDGRAFTRSLVEDPDNTLLLQEVQLTKGGAQPLEYLFIPLSCCASEAHAIRRPADTETDNLIVIRPDERQPH